MSGIDKFDQEKSKQLKKLHNSYEDQNKKRGKNIFNN